MNNLITSAFRSGLAADFVRSFQTNRYFLFTGDHTPNPSDTVASEVVRSEKMSFDVFSNMQHGKAIDPTNVSLMVPRIVWQTGKVFPEYTHLEDRVCHVVVENGTTYNVYKCLDNNNGAVSTVAPIGNDPTPITTSDGYVWRYLFGIPALTYEKFVTTKQMPFVNDQFNRLAATSSSVDVVQVINGGVGYTNHFEGQIRAQDVIDSTHIRLVETASNITNLYKGCIIKVTTPTSTVAGQYRRITGYSVAGVTKTVTIDRPFNGTPSPTDEYEISPEVVITSSGTNATSPVARAIIDPAQADSVVKIEVLMSGYNVRSASALVYADPSVGLVTPASLVPIIGPSVGHGGDPMIELNGRSVAVRAEIQPTDTDLPLGNDFRQFGLIKNPKFANITLTVSGAGFVDNEQVLQYEQLGLLSQSGSLTDTSLSGSPASVFLSTLRSGDPVLVTDGITTRITFIDTVINDAFATTKTPVGNINNAQIFGVSLIADGVVTSSTTSDVTLRNASAGLRSNGKIYGVTSHTIKTVTGLTGNKGRGSMDTFVQAIVLTGTVTNGTFLPDEKVIQGNNSADLLNTTVTGGNNLTVYATNELGSLTTGLVTGSVSGAVANITAKYNGDLAADQGQIVYIENVVPITHANENETFTIVLEF